MDVPIVYQFAKKIQVMRKCRVNNLLHKRLNFNNKIYRHKTLDLTVKCSLSILNQTSSNIIHHISSSLCPRSFNPTMCPGCLWTEAMESPSSTVRRRAWINSSRQWLTPEELDSEGLQCNPSASIVDDDVFSDGESKLWRARGIPPHMSPLH